MTADKRPFKGIKVLEVSRVVASPFAGYQLSLLGADVIKIEDPGKGDTTRSRDRGSNPRLVLLDDGHELTADLPRLWREIEGALP